MTIRLDREGELPLYLQIADHLRRQILRGDLPAGTRLPPERKLAEELAVNRTTVVNAYRELAADGLVEGHVGRGTLVQPIAREANERGPVPLHWQNLMVPAAPSPQENILAEMSALTNTEGVIALVSAMAAPDLFPHERFREAVATAAAQRPDAMVIYAPVEGYGPLRELLAERLRAGGATVDPSHLLVTTGAQQAIDLLARALIEPGDTVFVEAPTYMGALRSFGAAGARLVGIPMAEGGMRLDMLEDQLLRRRPKCIYTIPTYQNPTGALLDGEGRRRLLALAYRFGVPVVEDSTYSDLYYEAPPPPSLLASDSHGHVIQIGTISKVLAGALRVGWLVAPQPVIGRLTRIKQHDDVHTSVLPQAALAAMMASGDLDRHLTAIRGAYPQRRDALVAALRDHAPETLRWRVPQGGMSLWCRLPGLRARDLLAEAERAGVVFVAGEVFFPGGTGGEESFRLAFSGHRPATMAEAGRRIGLAAQALLRRSRGRIRERPALARTPTLV